MNHWPVNAKAWLLKTRILKAIGPEHVRAHKHASRHREEIERSDRCGCFYCLETFRPQEIKEWIDDDTTAMCPLCGIDSVIGSAAGFSLSRDFLSRMHTYWFEDSIELTR